MNNLELTLLCCMLAAACAKDLGGDAPWVVSSDTVAGSRATSAAAMSATGAAAQGGSNAAEPAANRNSPGSALASAGRSAQGGASAAGSTGTATRTSATSSTSTKAAAAGGAAMSGPTAGSVAPSGSDPTSGFSEHSGADCAVSAGELKQNPKLPDPFRMHDGTRIATKADWRCRRSEIKQDLEKFEIGPKPEPPMVEASYADGKLSVKVTTDAGSITLSSNVTAGSDGGCVAIGMNSPSSLVSGCTQVPFMHDQVVKYGSDSSQLQSDPFYKVYPDLWKKIGNYAAWSWGISRLIDGLVQLKDELKIDAEKIAVHGCSYAGKMALFAGAFDERVALTVVQESGGGGINAWRTSQDFTTRTGTNIEKIDNTSGAWFLPSMKQLDPYSLPHDHHQLIAMIAPRPVVALGNQDYEWLGDESGWKSINAAKEVWKALGREDYIGFDFTSNHSHCAAAASQSAAVKAYVDRFLKGQTTDTAIVVEPQDGNFELDFKKSIDWDTPTLQ